MLFAVVLVVSGVTDAWSSSYDDRRQRGRFVQQQVIDRQHRLLGRESESLQSGVGDDDGVVSGLGAPGETRPDVAAQRSELEIGAGVRELHPPTVAARSLMSGPRHATPFETL